MHELAPYPEYQPPRANPAMPDARPAGSAEDLFAAGMLEYGKIVLRRKYTILALTLVGGVIGFLWTIAEPFRYRAVTSVEFQAGGGGVIGNPGGPPGPQPPPPENNPPPPA